MNKCIDEIDTSQKVFTEKTHKTSKALLEQKKNIEELATSFLKQTKQSPWVFQKCSLRGLYIAKQCLGSIREDSNQLCQDEMFIEMERLGKQLGDYHEQAKLELEIEKQRNKIINFEPVLMPKVSFEEQKIKSAEPLNELPKTPSKTVMPSSPPVTSILNPRQQVKMRAKAFKEKTMTMLQEQTVPDERDQKLKEYQRQIAELKKENLSQKQVISDQSNQIRLLKEQIRQSGVSQVQKFVLSSPRRSSTQTP